MFRSLSTLVLLLLVALPGVALAQATGVLTGTVVDEQGQTLIGANVRIDGTTLGAATDVNGQYRVIGVPIGTYDITASYTGYQSVTQENVPISANVNRVVDFTLSQDASLDEIVVEYERPLVERSAIGAPRAISGEDIQNLPVRGVASVTALQSGVVSSSQGLNIRGGRGGEVAYYVDGVRINGNLAVNQAAIAEQEMLIGTIPARYGDVQSGVISITTETGRSEFFGSLEGVTSRGLDSYGYNLGSLAIGGPLLSDRIGFFATVEGTAFDDASPYGIESYRLTDDNFDLVQRRPQAFLFENDEGDEMYIPFPAELFDETPYQNASGGPAAISAADIDAAYADAEAVPEGYSRTGTSPIPTASTFTQDAFETTRGKDDPADAVTFNGSLNFNVLPTVSLRVGGGYQYNDGRGYSYGRSFYDRNYSYSSSEYWRVYGTLRQRVGTNSFYQITGEYQNDFNLSHPEDFSGDVRETLFYGDIDSDRWQIARRYIQPATAGGFQRRNYQDAIISIGSVDPGTFTLPGASQTGYSKSRTEQFGVTGNASTQVGVHQVEFGGEYRQNTNRGFAISPTSLARYYADGTNIGTAPGIPAEGVTNYEDLSYQVLNPLVTYYGYDFRGLEEQDGQNVDAYFTANESGAPTDPSIDAWRPYYYAGYVSDRIEFSDLIFDIGLRVDAFNANTLVLRDLFANRPIIRASDLRTSGFNVPGSIGDDYGVYYAGGVEGNQNVIGYRDLDGNQYNTSGEQITNADVQALSGAHVPDENANPSAAFRESETNVAVMPRLGVSFPVTDRALFFASYNVIAQRPTQSAFTTFNRYVNAASSSRLANTGLEPQRTTQYELGFRQRVGERAALTLQGFYRTQDNLVALQKADGGLTPYSFYVSRDFSTSQGAEVAFELRRTNNLAINANYTLSFAKATGSDANTLGTVAWRGDTFPNFISPADFDQRHTGNLTVDYRFGAGEGPMFGDVRPFENFGVNLVAQFGSGQRYTPLLSCGEFNVNDSFTCNTTGNINSATLPANYQLDLKLDRRFDLGFAGSKMQIYLLVLNVLDTQNVYAVYRETGQVDNQGFFNGALGAQRLNAYADPAGTLFNYQAYTGGPVNVGGNQSSGGGFYGSPRRIRLGALFTF